jgi:HSP20 family protein
MSLIKWRNSNLLPGLTDWADNFFNLDDDTLTNWRKGLTVPAVNVAESDQFFDLEMAVPGMPKDAFRIEVDKGMLTVSAEQEESSEEQKNDYTRQEFNYRSFRRSFWLPENVNPDNIEAKYEDGLLKLRIPKITTKKLEAVRQIPVL